MKPQGQDEALLVSVVNSLGRLIISAGISQWNAGTASSSLISWCSAQTLEDSLITFVTANLATSLTNLDYAISSELDGNPPLWVTRRRDIMHDDIYVNNARVLASRSYQAYNKNKNQQVCNLTLLFLLIVDYCHTATATETISFSS